MVRGFPDELHFLFLDPGASSVEIHGRAPDGVRRSWSMTRGSDGAWRATVELDAAWSDFRYLVDGRFWAIDGGRGMPAACAEPDPRPLGVVPS